MGVAEGTEGKGPGGDEEGGAVAGLGVVAGEELLFTSVNHITSSHILHKI